MFERFTEKARQVVVLAQEESSALKHTYIGTEHLLLALLRVNDGVVTRALEALGVTAERVRARLLEIVAPGTSEQTSGQIPFTPRAKKVLDTALHESMRVGSNAIGPEHLLLALQGEGDSTASRILLELDAGPHKIRRAVVAIIERPADQSGAMDPDMDRSWLDFTPDDACALAKRLAPLASRIRFEVRSHGEQEQTFRVSCRPRGDDTTLRGLVELEAVGIRAILDHDGTVRLGHIV
jgi:ATP-dependent Clp protease ATP-binding subunit ClpA